MSNNSNRTNVPEAKEAMDRFKMEVANEIGVPSVSYTHLDVYKRQPTAWSAPKTCSRIQT